MAEWKWKIQSVLFHRQNLTYTYAVIFINRIITSREEQFIK